MLPMKQVLLRVAKGPAPGAPIAMQLLTLGPKPVPASSPTATLNLPSTLLRSASLPGGVVSKGIDTGGCVLRADRVVEQRTRAIGRIVTGSGIAKERINPSGRVLRADRVAVERLHARGGV